MTSDPRKRRRRSIRLRGYDYSQPGAYFVTICTRDRACLFGEVVDGEMRLNGYGRIVQDAWHDLSNHYVNVVLDAFVIIPNHVHGIVIIVDDVVGAGFKPAPTEVNSRHHNLPEIIRGFKTFSARRVNEHRNTPGVSAWQRNYFEHIIRNEESLNRIRQYIHDNPARWAMDRENPLAATPEPEDAWQA